MTKYSLEELRYKVNNIQSQIKEKQYQIRNCRLIVTHKFNDRIEQLSTSRYNFEDLIKELENLSDELLKFKREILRLNSEKKIEFEFDIYSINELIFLKETFENKLSFLNNLISCDEGKNRCDVSSSGVFYYEIKTLTFDPAIYEKEKIKLISKIDTIKALINKYNSSCYVEL